MRASFSKVQVVEVQKFKNSNTKKFTFSWPKKECEFCSTLKICSCDIKASGLELKEKDYLSKKNAQILESQKDMNGAYTCGGMPTSMIHLWRNVFSILFTTGFSQF